MSLEARLYSQEVLLWSGLSEKDRFSLVFGKPAQELQPSDVMTEIRRRFDAFREMCFQALELGTTADRRAIALEKTVTAVASEFPEYRSTSGFYVKYDELKKAVQRAVEAAQPFVQEDLSFIAAALNERGTYADSDTMINTWTTAKKPGGEKLIKSQKEILRGKITLKTR
jgi:hypothetical protein